MSKQKHIIIVEPDKYSANIERMTFGNYKCPACGGSGHFVEQIGRDEYKTTECSFCSGTGNVKAIVTIEWLPDM